MIAAGCDFVNVATCLSEFPVKVVALRSQSRCPVCGSRGHCRFPYPYVLPQGLHSLLSLRSRSPLAFAPSNRNGNESGDFEGGPWWDKEGHWKRKLTMCGLSAHKRQLSGCSGWRFASVTHFLGVAVDGQKISEDAEDLIDLVLRKT